MDIYIYIYVYIFSLVQNSVGSRLCLRRVLVTRQMSAHSFKMNGLLLASYRANSTPCSLTTCVATAACAYTSPQPTDCSGPWVLGFGSPPP